MNRSALRSIPSSWSVPGSFSSALPICRGSLPLVLSAPAAVPASNSRAGSTCTGITGLSERSSANSGGGRLGRWRSSLWSEGRFEAGRLLKRNRDGARRRRRWPPRMADTPTLSPVAVRLKALDGLSRKPLSRSAVASFPKAVLAGRSFLVMFDRYIAVTAWRYPEKWREGKRLWCSDE